MDCIVVSVSIILSSNQCLLTLYQTAYKRFYCLINRILIIQAANYNAYLMTSIYWWTASHIITSEFFFYLQFLCKGFASPSKRLHFFTRVYDEWYSGRGTIFLILFVLEVLKHIKLKFSSWILFLMMWIFFLQYYSDFFPYWYSPILNKYVNRRQIIRINYGLNSSTMIFKFREKLNLH